MKLECGQRLGLIERDARAIRVPHVAAGAPNPLDEPGIGLLARGHLVELEAPWEQHRPDLDLGAYLMRRFAQGIPRRRRRLRIEASAGEQILVPEHHDDLVAIGHANELPAKVRTTDRLWREITQVDGRVLADTVFEWQQIAHRREVGDLILLEADHVRRRTGHDGRGQLGHHFTLGDQLRPYRRDGRVSGRQTRHGTTPAAPRHRRDPAARTPGPPAARSPLASAYSAAHRPPRRPRPVCSRPGAGYAGTAGQRALLALP